MIVTIAGPDASGKSTITKLVKASLLERGLGVELRDKWEIIDSYSHPECRFIGVPLSELRRCTSEMKLPARTLFLFWTMYSTMLGEPTKNVVLLDSYWIKHAAAEQAYGSPATLVRTLCDFLPRSDFVFYLDIAPDIAWDRKEKTGFSDVVPYECGMDKDMKKESFVKHQRLLGETMKGWCEEFGWIVLDGDSQPSLVADIIVGTILGQRISNQHQDS